MTIVCKDILHTCCNTRMLLCTATTKGVVRVDYTVAVGWICGTETICRSVVERCDWSDLREEVGRVGGFWEIILQVDGSNTERPTLPSRHGIGSFTCWGLETSSWSSSCSLDRPTLQRHWICPCQPQEACHSTGPWWSDTAKFHIRRPLQT